MTRTVLLPKYLEDNQVWIDMMSAMDDVLTPLVDDPIQLLSKLRDFWLMGDVAEEKANSAQMLDSSDFLSVEREVLIKQCTLVGFDHFDPSIFNSEDYVRISRHISSYFLNRGGKSFIDFFGFCLGAQFTINTLWTEDGFTFFPEGSPSIGNAVYERTDLLKNVFIDHNFSASTLGWILSPGWNRVNNTVVHTGAGSTLSTTSLSLVKGSTYTVTATVVNGSSAFILQGLGIGGQDIVPTIIGNNYTWQWTHGSTAPDHLVFWTDLQNLSLTNLSVIQPAGTWFPTTLVQLELDIDRFKAIRAQSVRDFFYFVAPINLVLSHVVSGSKSEGGVNILLASTTRRRFRSE